METTIVEPIATTISILYLSFIVKLMHVEAVAIRPCPNMLDTASKFAELL